MILFQISLSGHMLRFLVQLEAQDRSGEVQAMYEFPNLISTFHALQREKLATHEMPIRDERWSAQTPPYRFKTKGRRFVYEITPKGRLALQLAAMDLQQFLDEVRHDAAIPDRKYYTELAAGKPIKRRGQRGPATERLGVEKKRKPR